MPLPTPPPSPGDRSGRPLPTPPPASSVPPAPPTGGTGSASGDRCYRHGDRAAGRRCTRCGKPACGECLVQANVGSHCLECAKAAQPSVATRAKYWSAGQASLVTMTLIGLNIAVFVLAGLASGNIGRFLSGSVTESHLDFGLSLPILEFTGTAPDIALTGDSRWLRLVTSGFMHFGILHLLMNMYFLYVLGPQLEQPLGRPKYLLLYVASLLGGSAGVLLLDSGGITAGASGAVFGLLGATAVGMWQHGINPFKTSIGTVLLINLFLTFSISGISIGGHLGGLVAGGICGYVMLTPGHRPMPQVARWGTPVVVSVIAVAISVVLAT